VKVGSKDAAHDSQKTVVFRDLCGAFPVQSVIVAFFIPSDKGRADRELVMIRFGS
jgi:hypothetical protein